jgi:tetratricopeptide (TPR) repeat protein
LILVAASTTAGYVQTKAALNGEKAERERAEAATEVGLNVLDNMFERFAPQRFDPLQALIASGTDATGSDENSMRPALSPDTAAVLESMLTFYDRLAEQSSDNKRFRRKAAQANRRIGDIRQHLGQFDEAVAAYDRALDIYRALDETDDAADFAREQANIYNELGFAYPMMGQPEAAQQSHLKAMEILESVLPENSAPEVRYELAKTYYRLARADRWDMVPRADSPGPPHAPRDWDAEPRRPFPPPAPHLRRPGPLRDRLPPPRQPDGPRPLPGWDPGQDTDRDFGEDTAQQREVYLRKAVNLLKELAGRPSCEPDHAAFLACVHHALGTLQMQSDRLDDAVVNYRNAVSVQSDLVSRFPENASYNIVLGWLEQPLANGLREQGDLNEARRLLEISRDILDLELAADPDMFYLRGLVVQAYFSLADVLRELGEEEMADQASRQADEYSRQTHRLPPRARGRNQYFGRGEPPHAGPEFFPGAFGPSGPP